MQRKKQWRDMGPGQRAAVIGAAVVELVLTAMALVDLARRSSEQVRGPRWLWIPGVFVQPIGPIAYLLLGRRSITSSSRSD